MYPMYSLLHAARRARDIVESSIESIFKLPALGRSMPAMRLSSVVFPLPLGPISARNSPAAMSRSSASSGLITISPRRYSRVTCLHSMSAMTDLLTRFVGFADHANLLAFAQALRIGEADESGQEVS